MSEKWLVNRGPHNATVVHYDDLTDNLTVENIYDVEPALDQARFARDHKDAVGHGKDLRHVTEIPMDVLAKSMKEGWSPADWKRWANDPDNRMFRVWGGKI